MSSPPLSASSSPLSSLSSAPDEVPVPDFMLDDSKIADSEAPSSDLEDEAPKYKREESPEHIPTLADNPDIAFIVMFRARFSEAFSQKLIHFGPQDIERGVVDPAPSPQVEQLLCALLGLVLNRKKPIENGHYGRAMEEAITSNKSQWPSIWKGVNPLRGERTFNDLDANGKLNILRTLVMWSLHESEVINAILKDAYKQQRTADDTNVPLSVQPWGRDELKRRYWLIEGRDDTDFRLYRESNPALKTINTWENVAGSIDELKLVVEKLEKDKAQASKRLAQRITMAIPRFEASEEKRRRREYRLARKAAFSRPEPGFSMYEGRTRGKRARYTYDDEGELDDDSEAFGNRRSTRTSGVATPREGQPTTTLSGRQVRSRVGGLYGESLLSEQNTNSRATPATDISDEPVRASRSGRAGVVNRKVDEEIETSSEGEWDGGDEDEPDEAMPDLDDEDEASDRASEDGEESEDDPQSLVVILRYGKGRTPLTQHLSGPLSDPPRPKTTVEVVIPSAPQPTQPSNLTPQSSTSNGYPTPTSGANGVNEVRPPSPLQQSTIASPVRQLPPIQSSGPKKQTQLPFQPMPQHIPNTVGYKPGDPRQMNLPYSPPRGPQQ